LKIQILFKKLSEYDEIAQSPDQGLIIFCRGLGIENQKKEFAQMASHEFLNFFHGTIVDQEVTWPYPQQAHLTLRENALLVCAKRVNEILLEKARKKNLTGAVGVSINILWFSIQHLTSAWIGHCPLWRYRGGEVVLIHIPDTLGSRRGLLTPEYNIPLSILGVENEPVMGTKEMTWSPEDLYLWTDPNFLQSSPLPQKNLPMDLRHSEESSVLLSVSG